MVGFSKYFELYKKVEKKCEHYISMRSEVLCIYDGKRGIAVSSDKYARKWNSVQIRRYILDCYLSGLRPTKEMIELLTRRHQ